MESFRDWGESEDKGYWGSDKESSALVPQAYRITVPGGPSHDAVFGCRDNRIKRGKWQEVASISTSIKRPNAPVL